MRRLLKNKLRLRDVGHTKVAVQKGRGLGDSKSATGQKQKCIHIMGWLGATKHARYMIENSVPNPKHCKAIASQKSNGLSSLSSSLMVSASFGGC